MQTSLNILVPRPLFRYHYAWTSTCPDAMMSIHQSGHHGAQIYLFDVSDISVSRDGKAVWH